MGLTRLLMIVLLFIGCKEEQVIPTAENEIIVQHQQSASKTINGKGWAVTFLSIKENSLCPPNSECIWQGRLVVALKINQEEVELGLGDLTTNSETEIANQIVIGGVMVTFSEAHDYTDTAKTKVVLSFE
ncbi:hypothetical protein [Ekhidna sp.]|uniref:hypothetical protein n=1 Tax=Ekhidna sp. TaxID=2608089 RepID=UPI003CCC1533